MMRSEAITEIKKGLGFRQTQDATIVSALKEAQKDLELGKTLPNFLLERTTSVVVTPGSPEITLPTGFIRLSDEYFPYYLDTANKSQYLSIRKYAEALEAYYIGADITASGTYPKVLVVVNKTQGLIYPVPTVTTLTSLFIPYYKKADVLNTDIENAWLREAPNLMIGLAGMICAGSLRDKGAMEAFNMRAKRGANALMGDIVEDELAGRGLVMGRNN